MSIEALYAIGILLVLGGLVYGTLRARNRNRANDPIRDEATRQIYDNPERYEQGGKQALDRQLKPEK